VQILSTTGGGFLTPVVYLYLVKTVCCPSINLIFLLWLSEKC
jgi:hypothetical protein